MLANLDTYDASARAIADPNRIAVAGEGAGGNLAVNVSMRARDEHIVLPKHQLLVYPVATTTMATDSYKEWA